jgi:thiamine-monophosphate kinase
VSSKKTELERVALLAARFGAPGAGISTGIGDDAAVFTPPVGPLVWTIDAQIEGTHFRLDWLSWQDVGWRSFMAAASDLAAMGAEPIAALSALGLAGSVDDAALEALAEGQAEAARVVRAPVIGGNLARATETSVTTTLLGRAERPILRSGARPGDGLFLAGPVGEAAAGLAILERGLVQNASIAACVRAWRRPRALIERGAAMRDRATAAIDISDGLARDAAHVAEASGVTLVFAEDALRARASAELGAAAQLVGRDVLDLILAGGEDYALLATSASPIEGFSRVGVVEAGPARVLLERADRTRRAVDARGFDHFA